LLGNLDRTNEADFRPCTEPLDNFLATLFKVRLSKRNKGADLLWSILQDGMEIENCFGELTRLAKYLPSEIGRKPITGYQLVSVVEGFDGSSMSASKGVGFSQPCPTTSIVRICAQSNLERLNSTRIVSAML
jgi:hypothetical protein